MAIIAFTFNAYVYIEILDNVLISSREYWFGEGEIIFKDSKASCDKGKEK